MEDLLLKLKTTERNEEFQQIIDKFLKSYSDAKTFECLDKTNSREQIWESIFTHLKNEKESSNIIRCLSMLKILSRDKTNLNNIVTKEKIVSILEYAKLNAGKDDLQDFPVINEAQKLLCNLLFNSSNVSSIIMETSCVENVLQRISKHDSSKPDSINLFDIRIIFLITALNKQSRNFVRTEFHADVKLIAFLENIMDSYKENKNMSDADAELICEVMKALFNLFIKLNKTTPDELKEYEKMILLLRKILVYDNEKYKESLVCNTINLLTVIPSECYGKLISPLADKQGSEMYQGFDVSVIDIFIKFLSNKLECKSNLIENLSPVLTSFIRMCRRVRIIRKYVRLQVLPPLREVRQRPEEGTTIRNKLCKLLTTPITEVRDLDAEFLFVLCKENVGRMIKYTGYGNAAGMFANKGLLGPEHARIDYSSDSEDSDTEEYEKYKDKINPVLGCYEEPKPNPFEGMSEEQKEHEAMKLVSLVDKLQRQGVIQPCSVGEDGKPKVIGHVLELQNKLPEQQIGRRNSNSDSD